MRDELLSPRRLLWAASLLVVSVGLFFLGQNILRGEERSFAKFQLCPAFVPPKDIVFLVDQSKTVWDSDNVGARWDVLSNLIAKLYADEANLNKAAGIKAEQTRIAVIPFGGDKKKEHYLARIPLQWFQREEKGPEVFHYLNGLKRESKDKTKMARHTDFKTAFEQLEKLLKKSGASRQTQADRYIILITDGRYDPNDTKCFEDDERKMFTGIVDSLQNRKGKWPVYFVGIGKPFYEEYEACKQLKVDVPLLERMAQALPLPDTLADGSERPIFSNTRRRSKNLVTIISDNDEYNREQLQNHLEMILRGSLPVAVAPPTNSKVELPQADPRRMEIDVELESPKTTEALAKALKLFLKTSHHDELFPLVPGTIQAQDSSLVHTLVVDSAKLRGQILGPDPKRAFVPESWGLEVEDHNIILKRVNLKMRYNWSVYIDSCYFDTVATPRSWELRMRNRHEPLKYRLIIQVRAVHPCGGELTNERLRVIVNDEDEWLLEKPKRLQRPWSRTLDKTTIKDTCNVYSWRKEIAHQEIFARRVGRPVRVRIILEDLFDYQIQLDPVVPFNGIPVDTLAEGR